MTGQKSRFGDLPQRLARLFFGLGEDIVSAGDVVDEPKTFGNRIKLLAGRTGALRLLKTDTMVHGSPGSVVTDASRFSASGMVESVEFLEEVTLGADAKMQFIECVFRKPVACVAGAQARFISCLFAGTAAVDNSAGVNLDVWVVDCTRTSGVLHQNITYDGGEVT